MKLDQLADNVNLTYCTNIHAGESWPDIRASLDAHVPRSKPRWRGYVDPPDAVAAFKEGRANGEWRLHCHVPLFLSDLGEIGSTRADLVSTLAAFRRKTRSSHLEVETYTWDVLPENLRTGSKAAHIARENSFCVKELVG